MNLNNILRNTNYWYKNAFETDHARKPVFLEVLAQLNNQPVNILEIGATGGDMSDPNYIHGAGGSSFYFAEYIRQNGGSLTVVDLNPQTLENCKVMLEDFVKTGINIKFVCSDGLAFLKQNNNFDFIYLDGPDQEVFTFECFRLINRTKTTVLIDDANGWDVGQGKCVRTRKYYDGYRLFKCGISHEMIVYDTIKGNNQTFKVGNLELEYIREDSNSAWRNERSVELGLGKWFAEKFNNQIFEIGDVCPHYSFFNNWRVLDPDGPYINCIRKDVMDQDYSGLNVLSISTFEHMNNTEYQNNDADLCIKALKKVVSEAANHLITIPIGAWRPLEDFIKNQKDIKYTFLVRENKRGETNNWYQKNDLDLFYANYLHFEYELNYYGSAEVVCVMTNQKEIC